MTRLVIVVAYDNDEVSVLGLKDPVLFVYARALLLYQQQQCSSSDSSSLERTRPVHNLIVLVLDTAVTMAVTYIGEFIYLVRLY